MHQEGVQLSARTFVGALKACSSLATGEEGKQIDGKVLKVGCLERSRAMHFHLIRSGFESDVYVGTTLVDMYMKCGSMEDARCVFDVLPHRSVIFWNAMILGYSKQQEGGLALNLYARMQQEGVIPDHRTFIGVLKACSSVAELEEGMQVDEKYLKLSCLEKGRAIHCQAVKSGFELEGFLGNTLVDMYAKCGSMEDAQRVFDKLLNPDVISWTAMIMGYSKQEVGALAMELYAEMQREGITPDHRSFVGALKACSSLAALEEKQLDGQVLKIGCLGKGRTIHSQVIKSGFEQDGFVGNTLVDMYAKCGSMEDARCVFDQLPHLDVVAWTAMISGYAESGEGAQALELYARMQLKGVTSDHRSFVGALKACSSLASTEEGKQGEGETGKIGCLEICRTIHSQVVKSGFDLDVFMGTTLVDMYTKYGEIVDARRVFDELPCRSVVSWTAMILAYSKRDEGALALELYAQMQQEGVTPDQRIFVGVLKACSGLTALEEGKQVDQAFLKIGCLEKGRAVHSQVVKAGFESDVFLGTTLVDMYIKCGNVEDARHVFDQLPCRDVVTWTTLMLGYTEQEKSEETFRLYAQMQEQGISPDSFAFVAILKACSNTAALEIGKEIHYKVSQLGLETTAVVANSLVDMYAKCGSMDDAQQVFDTLPTRNVVTWSSLIAGYARRGESELVFLWFERMRQEGVQPDGVAFLSVLTLCSHAGLLGKGQKYFESMCKDYGIGPTVEHYTCMVDLLGRAGQVLEAATMVEKMHIPPNGVIWLTVLGACQKWNNVEVGRLAFENLVSLDDKLPAAYILMSNIYADAGLWDDHDKIQVMRECVSIDKPG